MKIILKNHNETYSVREIVNAYFPKEKIEFVNEVSENDNVIVSKYEVKNDCHIYETESHIGGKTEKNILNCDEYNKINIKKNISNCLEKITGIKLPWGVMTGIRPSKNVREFAADNNGVSPIDYLENHFACSPAKAKLACEVYKNESKILENKYANGVSLYIGIPFCPTRCLYCSFTSQSIAFSNKLVEPYINALVYEIEEISKTDYIKNKVIETIYFGGGTPSALNAEQIDLLLTKIENSFDISKLKELTFEAGRPDTITEEKLIVLRKHGITRISINPQTSNDITLKKIGRNHTDDDFLKSFSLARNLGFSHINCDIIAGLPDENENDFKNTVREIAGLSPESITVHTMCIKHGSYLDMKYSMYSLSKAETVNNMLDIAYTSAYENGYIPYYLYRQKNMLGNLENVGYCKKSHECLYNIYIMEEVHNIIALGAGGSTKLVDGQRIERVFNVKEVSEYIKRIDEMINRKTFLFNQFK